MLAGTTLGLAGIGTVIALILGAASSSPAFAVTRNQDGSVSVAIKSIGAIAGANQTLKRMGLRVAVVQVKATCASGHALAPIPRALAQARAVAQTRVDPGKIPVGKMLVLAAWRKGSRIHLAPAHWTTTQIPACLPVPLLPPPCGGALPPLPKPSGPGAKHRAGEIRALRLARAMVAHDQRVVPGHLKVAISKQAPVPLPAMRLAPCKRWTKVKISHARG